MSRRENTWRQVKTKRFYLSYTWYTAYLVYRGSRSRQLVPWLGSFDSVCVIVMDGNCFAVAVTAINSSESHLGTSVT